MTTTFTLIVLASVVLIRAASRRWYVPWLWTRLQAQRVEERAHDAWILQLQEMNRATREMRVALTAFGAAAQEAAVNMRRLGEVMHSYGGPAAQRVGRVR